MLNRLLEISTRENIVYGQNYLSNDPKIENITFSGKFCTIVCLYEVKGVSVGC